MATAPAAADAAPLTKAHATAIGKKINLRGSDFPGYSVTADKPTKAEKALAKSAAKCVGNAPEFVDVGSSSFTDSSGSGFSSSTSFVSSLAAVKSDAKRAQTAHSRKCGEQSFAAAAKQAGASSAKVTLAPLDVPSVSGVSAIFGYQITVTFAVLGQTASLHGYEIDFARGNAEVEVDEIGPTAVSEGVMTKPLATLIQRAKQQVPAAGLALKH